MLKKDLQRLVLKYTFFDLDSLIMPSSTTVLFILSSLLMMTAARTLSSPDQFMPFLFSSVNSDDNGMLPPANGQNRLIVVVEQIIKFDFDLFFLS